MKAVVQDKYGAPDVLRLREIAKPVPNDDEVLIRIHASVVTLVDCAMRKADPFITRFFTGLINPRSIILGDVIAGEIESVGRNVTLFKPGDKVFGTVAPDAGAHAEFKCVPETAALVTKPANITYAEAAGLCDGFVTGLPFLRDKANIKAGHSILINGASGSIGTVSVQLAKEFGALVTGVCSTANLELVLSLGADHVIDYSKQDFTKSGETYDIIFDTVGKSSFSRCRGALKPDGAYLTTVPTPAILLQMLLTAKRGGKRAIFAATGLRSAREKAKDLIMLKTLVEAGRIRPVIDRRYPLAEIAEAHRYVETERKVGSVVIAMAEDA